MPSSYPSPVDEQVRSLLDVALRAVLEARMLIAQQQRAEDCITRLPGKQARLARGQGERPVGDGWLPQIERTGTKGIRILLRLMDEPDCYVSHAALSDAARLRSRSTVAIKVYICRIREALVEGGYSPDLIETGRSSYRIRAQNFEVIMKYLSGLVSFG